MRVYLLVALLVCALICPTQGAMRSSADWKTRTIYQLLTDRFNNPSREHCDDLSRYCGGTWEGIMEQLDYIQ
ncbi:glycoside hydrolase, family 13, partial [Kipferlia bialata]|eukprot:g11147.t1